MKSLFIIILCADTTQNYYNTITNHYKKKFNQSNSKSASSDKMKFTLKLSLFTACGIQIMNFTSKTTNLFIMQFYLTLKDKIKIPNKGR